ncbi:6-phospho-beta-glucosidase GmuD [Propionispora sp. 2/2-37]|uniref:glycoside hydrolase family 1 protein n=1 Tax=Propionispora sp. 2/2-37 TaxID=1677858 RepID=UPI0006BB7264|nr:glycoside hydrolase family 1 protein [Propionispora sp. 2/2-37]CUH95288.1 6-phospho-beta-glucosidase GmuD [Propionispora sp. 2/2-37]
MTLYTLPKDFLLGASFSAWQTEGWAGKKEKCDHFVDMMYKAAPERWHNGIGPAIATDFYHKWESDIELMAKSGMETVRTSVDWTRFIDNYEQGTVNEDGARFYDQVIDGLLKHGIEPMICLEHWELPVSLYEKYGGYASSFVVDCYVKFAEKVFERYRNKVKYWWTFNEPIVIPQLCFMDGFWYPYRSDTKVAMQWIYGKILCNAKAIKRFRQMNISGSIGIILNPALVYGRSTDNPQDVQAQKIADLFYWRSFMDPCIKGEFPLELIELLEKEACMFTYREEDLQIIKENTIDILGMNYYQPMRVMAQRFQWNETAPFHPGKYFEEYNLQGKKVNPWRGWEIYPQGIYDIAMRIKLEYDNIPWLISENGMGVEDEGRYRDASGIIQDDYRIEFMKEHLAYLLNSVSEGSNCKGYMVWNWLDNISPVNSLKNRYGLVELDPEHNYARIMKKSGEWFKRLHDARQFQIDSLEKEYR